MQVIGAVALFCDEVRQEGSAKINKATIVGVHTKNKTEIGFPSEVAVCIYVRILIDPKSEPEDLNIVLRVPGGKEMVIAQHTKASIEAAREAVAPNFPITTLASTVSFSAQMKSPGGAEVYIKWGDEERICGAVSYVASAASAGISGRA